MCVWMDQAHWCGAGEDDEEGVDDDAPHRSNQSHSTATELHPLMVVGGAAAELSVSTTSSTATSVPHATDASPLLNAQSQPISPLPRSPSLPAVVPTSPSKSVLGIQIDSNAAASLSLVVRASLGAARPLQTLTPVSSVGAHLNLLGSPSSAALSALSAALVSASSSASTALADGSCSSVSASPTHRGGCVRQISTHAIVLITAFFSQSALLF